MARPATDVAEAIVLAGKAGRPVATEYPDANFQWYLSRARHTVYFAAYSPKRMSAEDFHEMVTNVMTLAPQLHLRHDDRRQVHIDARPYDLDAIVTHKVVPSFEGFPDNVLGPNEDMFEDSSLPCFRAECYALPEGVTGPDGNCSFVVYRCSHALMEGVDSAALLRGRPSDHRAKRHPAKRLGQRFVTGLISVFTVPANLVIAGLQWRKIDTSSLRTLTIDRASFKRTAQKLGVQQRSLLFALVMYGLYHKGEDGPPTKRRRIVGYSNLTAKRYAGDDEFVRLRMQITTFGYDPSFISYVKAVDEKLAKAGNSSLSLQMHYNAIFSVHRKIEKVLPFLYGRRFFNFVPYDFVLSLVPPHSPGGVFTALGLNDVYCGSHTPGVNCCVIVPQGDRISFNVYAPVPVLDRIGGIEALLAGLDTSTLPPPPPPAMEASSARSPGVA